MGDKDKPELRMNLAAVKKVDPYAKDIIDTSSYVAFYTFNAEGNEWEKTNVEGPFFVYSRNAEPYHSIFVHNRLNTNSLVEPITAEMEILLQPPFLLYRNERTRIRGFWFYNLAECDRNAELVSKLVESCKNEKKMDVLKTVPPPPPQSGGVNNNNTSIDIFSMLSKAQEDFTNAMTGSNQKPDNLGGGGTLNNSKMNQHPQQQQQQQQQEVTSSVLNFFASAKPNPTDVPIFQRMLSNPVPVEQIEKQQRASPPENKKSPPTQKKQQQKAPAIQQQPPPQQKTSLPPGILTGNVGANGNIGTIGAIENGLRMMRMQSPIHQGQELGSSPLATFLNSSNLQTTRNVSQSLLNATDVSDLESRQKPLNHLLRKTESSSTVSAPGRPALLLPTMFSTPLAPLNSQDAAGSKPGITNAQTSFPNNMNSQPNSILSEISKPEPLTQSQLLQAMSYLIKNDPDFVRKLHEAYLKSFTEMVSL